MAVQDWLNANVLGNATLSNVADSAMNFYDTWQGNEASNDALDTIVEGYDQGINQVTQDANATKDIFGDVYDTNMGNIQPYMDAGTTALDQYMGLMQDPSTIAQDPAYQWRYDTGLETRKRDLEAAGYADPMGSGARATGINDWASGFASQELDRALARDLPIIQSGQTGVNQGIVAGDSYSKGMAAVNDSSSKILAQLRMGKADEQSTKAILDSQAMTAYLQGANGLMQTIQSGQAPDLMSLISAALGVGGAAPGTTSDGASLWDMLGDAFGFDAGDEGIVQQVTDMLTGQPSDGSGGGVDYGQFFGDLTGGEGGIGDINWENVFDFSSLGTENFLGDLSNLITDIDFGSFSTDLFGDLDLGDIGSIDWENLFDFSILGGGNGESALFGDAPLEALGDIGSIDYGNLFSGDGGLDFQFGDDTSWMDNFGDTLSGWGDNIYDFFL